MWRIRVNLVPITALTFRGRSQVYMILFVFVFVLYCMNFMNGGHAYSRPPHINPLPSWGMGSGIVIV